MKLRIGTGFFLFFATSLASAQVVTYSVGLGGGQEVPSVPTVACGVASVIVDTPSGFVSVIGSYNNLSSSGTEIHLHSGGLGSNGSIVMTVPSPGGTSGQFIGSAVLTPTLVQLILDGQTYVDVHSTNHGGGEIRGQVVQRLTVFCPAEQVTDPLLSDTSGEAAYGPRIGDPNEAFNVSLACSSSPTSGVYSIIIKGQKTAGTLTSYGTIWFQNPRFLASTGIHSQSLVMFAPTDLVVPLDITLVGLEYVVQGYCGNMLNAGRVSNALVETIGIGI